MCKNKYGKLFCMILVLTVMIPYPVHGEVFQDSLYAIGAVLMDGDSGRVLYGKEAYKQMPMASTTKVMTCIIALENSRESDIVIVSEKAAAQPDVQLNMRADEKYLLKDLLFSLMLKSHNDSAVAIAEHVAGSVAEFASMMNQKALELGCEHTHFVTPNGLDASDEGGVHSTTPRDLALIMRYAIHNKRFLEITQTPDYSFTDISGERIFVLHNANALLGNMDGLLSGKTGFTADAGYCYVCAVRRDDRTFIVALLACGWPGNKGYKWTDTRKLIDYAFEQYHYREIYKNASLGALPVEGGIPVSGELFQQAYVNIEALGIENQKLKFLVREDEKIIETQNIPKQLTAPVHREQVVGNLVYMLNGEVICNYPVVAKNDIRMIDFTWCFKGVLREFLDS